MTALSMFSPLTTLAQGLQVSTQAILMILFVIVSVLMILIVLIQRPQGGGLSGAFGASADGAGQTAFGAKTGDALTLATVTIFVLFLLFAIGLNFSLRPERVSLNTTAGPSDGATTTTPGVPTLTDTEGNPIQLERVSPEDVPESADTGNTPAPATTTDTSEGESDTSGDASPTEDENAGG